MFPPGGAGFVGVPSIPAVRGALSGRNTAADADPQTIGSTGAAAATQTAYGNPFTMESDLRFPLEGMRNTGSYDEIRQNSGIRALVQEKMLPLKQLMK